MDFIKSKNLILVLSLAAQAQVAFAAIPEKGNSTSLSEQLSVIRGKALVLEKNLSFSLRNQKDLESGVIKIKKLMLLQEQEKVLTKKRIDELNRTISELELRRGSLRDKIDKQKYQSKKLLKSLERAITTHSFLSKDQFEFQENELFDSPRRKVLSGFVSQSLKELEALKIDLSDAYVLERQIQEEKEQLSYLYADMDEKQSILELNRQLQADILQKKYHERLKQLETYRKIKESESKVEDLIGQFNARKELQTQMEAERSLRKSLSKSLFEQQKGRLGLPVSQGKVISPFGKTVDPITKLTVFKKGIDIFSVANQKVSAIFTGRVVYAGELPDYGKVTILDHGDHFFSLVANLGTLEKKAGDAVNVGEGIGTSDSSGRPLYFEIRQRNIPVNPLQWVSTSFSLNK